MKPPPLMATAMLTTSLLFCANWAKAQVVFSCPFSGSGGDLLERGFYIQSYAGMNLGTVQLRYSSFDAGAYTVSMTARLGTYDGSIVGSTETVNFNLTGSLNDQAAVTYDFGGALAPLGSIVTFAQEQVSGPGSLYYDVGLGPCPGIVQTEGTSPPLDTFRRDSVGVIITQVPEPNSFLFWGSGLSGLAAWLTWQKRRAMKESTSL